MIKTSPLQFGFYVIILGVIIEVIERQDHQAAWVMVFILLLGMITFNANVFSQQVSLIISTIGGPVAYKVKKPTKIGGPIAPPK